MELMSSHDRTTVDRRRVVPSSTVGAAGVRVVPSSTVKPSKERIADIDRRRILAGWSHSELCRRAGIKQANWIHLRAGRWLPTTITLEKLETALLDIPPKRPPKVILGFHRMIMVELCRQLRASVDDVMAQDLSVQRPRNKAWLRAARINRMAIYITSVELELENAELGRALGCTRQNVKQARDDVEDWRDQKKIDRALIMVRAFVWKHGKP